MQDFCQELNQENAAEITQSLLFPILHSSLSYHPQCLTFPPGTQRPSSPPPASPASGPGSPGILHLLQSPPQPPLNLTLETSQTPLTPLHQPLSVSGSGEVSGRASTCLETKIWRTPSQRRSGTGPTAATARRCLSKSRLLAATPPAAHCCTPAPLLMTTDCSRPLGHILRPLVTYAYNWPLLPMVSSKLTKNKQLFRGTSQLLETCRYEWFRC